MAEADILRAVGEVRGEIRALTAAVHATNDRISALEDPILRILEASTKEPDGKLALLIQDMTKALNGLAGALQAALLELAEGKSGNGKGGGNG